MEKAESKISFDFKLAVFYHISMMVLFPLGFILSSKTILTISFTELIILISISIIHKKKHNWMWIKITLEDWTKAIATIIAGCILIYVTTNSFEEIEGPVTPWICAGIGIFLFNFLTSIKLAENTKEEFNLRCKNIQYTNSHKDWQTDKYKTLKMSYKVIFFIVWLLGAYLFYSINEYFDTYAQVPSAIKKIEVISHGQTYYVNENEQRIIITKGAIIIPIIILTVLFPLIMKFRFKIDLIGNKN